MELSDTELRMLVRASIARQLRVEPAAYPPARSAGIHASHALLPLARGGDSDGSCLIEPSVRCTHCGYCLSFGH
jgi:hypothetical protein